MNYRPLGRTGVRISPFCIGGMMFGRMGNADHADCLRIIHRALDAGINAIDTADVYAQGESEEIVGKALADGRRNQVFVATKAHFPMGNDVNQRGSSRRWIMLAVEDSLRRLKTDWIDLYQMHRPAPDTDIEETLRALDDLVHAGKIRYFGSSTFPPSQIVEAQWVARERRLTRFSTEQPPYSMLVRGVEAEVLPVCAQYGMGVLSWSPLAGGWLSGKWRQGGAQPPSTRSKIVPQRYSMNTPENEAKLAATEALARLAEAHGLSLIHLALAFVLRHPAVSSAIIGPRTMEHLETQLAALDVTLSDELLDAIDAIVPPGSNAAAYDVGWPNPALQASARRRPAVEAASAPSH